ncbi:MAG: pyruvate ferredoxin oxidoreductase subunit gamma [Phycisphaerae bacterium]|nr:MAG: pyruvate ferredoxin oxidoreductase subunit gamma [Phycisphaerae bacterium]
MTSSMYQVRFHGRGGQGVVTGAELLSVAAFLEGHYSQAFPSFGSERMGAPVAAFCRIHSEPIRLREPVVYPDALIVQDASLVRNPDLLAGLERVRVVVVNTRLTLTELQAPSLKERVGSQRILCLPATEMALKGLGRNVPNVAMLSAFCALSGLIGFDALAQAVRNKFSEKVADANLRVAEQAWTWVDRTGLSSVYPIETGVIHV